MVPVDGVSPRELRDTFNALDGLSQDDIRQQAAALGPWFHNLDLRGVRTAPEHFLGDVD